MNNSDDNRDTLADSLDLFDSYENPPIEAYEEDYTADHAPAEGVVGATVSYSKDVKVETEPYRLKSSLVISFEELLTITGVDKGISAGAILVTLPLSEDRGTIEQWIPKKLCCNLDLEANTVLVWDVFMKARIENMGGLAYEPAYA